MKGGHSPRGLSDRGDAGLPWRPSKHHHNVNFNGELSRVGHYPDEASLKAMSKMRKNQEESQTYDSPSQTQRKASSFRITKM